MKRPKTYKEMAKYQNMEVSRVKAITIMELLGYEMGLASKMEGEDWYHFEDKLTEIINSK